jgi:hypothetical protein
MHVQIFVKSIVKCDIPTSAESSEYSYQPPHKTLYTCSHGIVCGQCAKALIKRVFILPKRSVNYTTRLKPLQSCRDSFKQFRIFSFKQFKILTVYLLYIQ